MYISKNAIETNAGIEWSILHLIELEGQSRLPNYKIHIVCLFLILKDQIDETINTQEKKMLAVPPL